ncbi:UNVERIFIED_CONTAM: hypothetical protein GTU68_002671 [Idotea baltica]|nr:hypothetical protein [Idotea baltica]
MSLKKRRCYVSIMKIKRLPYTMDLMVISTRQMDIALMKKLIWVMVLWMNSRLSALYILAHLTTARVTQRSLLLA